MDNLLLIDRDKIEVTSNGRTLSLPLPQTLVLDLEIVNKDALSNEILIFLEKNEVVLGKTLILLSEAVCFISEKTKEPVKGSFLQDFAATLPFENPVAIEVNGMYVGTNRDLYECVVEAIGKRGANVRGVSPLFLASELMGKRELSEDVVALVTANETVYSKAYFNFNIPPAPGAIVETKAKNNKVTLILVGVFAVMLVILLVLIFRR